MDSVQINSIHNFDLKKFDSPKINTDSVHSLQNVLKSEIGKLSRQEKIRILLQTIRFIDLTTLAGDDSWVNVNRLCWRAVHPITDVLKQEIKSLGFKGSEDLHVGAVCVYPARVNDCHRAFKEFQLDPVKIACVVTGFPSGQFGLESRLIEIKYASECDADEIDVVINRALALDGDWNGVYEEIKMMRRASPNMRMKVILEVGELGSLQNVYKASWAAMLAGADFIKTSTGKVSTNATLPVGMVMCRAINEFFLETGIKVGFKPAGGLKTEADCLCWYKLIEWQLGEDWLEPCLFRIGASSLLNEIEKSLFKYFFNRQPEIYELSV
ncbi:deoxyribose-phosphate aldolase [Brevipalpus obovatus]|uniref:deoxyribose-phosphate aldolase n=1 Tax=Brevipalpus obovatus TaxID=246614 RepID=UPI003D9DEC9F